MAKAQAAAPAEPEARRDQVLRAAEALFARSGYRGVGLREIAAQVGIRAPSLFKHFKSKHALYNAVLQNIFARLADVAARLEGERPFAARLEDFERHLGETHFCWIGGTGDDDPFYYRIQGPVLLIEFDHHAGVFLGNPTPQRFHVHTVVRTPNGNDYGMAVVRRHCEQLQQTLQGSGPHTRSQSIT